MKGKATNFLRFMEGADKRFVIPIYQRNYNWRKANCLQLYEDLKKVSSEGRSSHFFGSIVSQVAYDGSYHIIDGQQRLTTVTLLLLAICNFIKDNEANSSQTDLDIKIKRRFIIDEDAPNDDRIKLRPVEADRDVLKKLVEGESVDKNEKSSNMFLNYDYFYNQIKQDNKPDKLQLPVDALYEAIGKLQIINILLEPNDNAQLIFESLNSTGLALTEGDKIRNYILMNLEPKQQDDLYNRYWTKIEKCTQNDVSSFARDYLSIKNRITPTIGNVYQAFKEYVEKKNIQLESLLKDMLKYARFYQKLKDGKSGLGSQELDDCMARLKHLEITVTEPFFMEILRLNQDGGKLSVDDVTQIFRITESYLFRRIICDVPTNALNKVFLNLNNKVIRYDDSADNYVQKFIYALCSKEESSRFPDDEEFSQALANRAVYRMSGKYKTYLFERFENYGTKETKDVYNHIENNVYSIEHIMPQHLTPEWRKELGPEAEKIHSTWLHRLGNLTLTAYNSNMSNDTFQEKRDAEHGYKKSGLRMNQFIAGKERWGLEEMQERNDEMVKAATEEIWVRPSTTFVPAKKEFDSCTLADEDYDLRGRDIFKYTYQDEETQVSSWDDMFHLIVKYLYNEDKSILSQLAYGTSSDTELSGCFSHEPDSLRKPLEIDEGIYFENNIRINPRISILRKLFKLFHADPTDLKFYLRDSKKETIFSLSKKWAEKEAEKGTIQVDLEHSSRSCIRFKTPEMSAILPDIEALSGWGTHNHYFFEIQNKTGKSAYINMCLNSQNLTAEQKTLCDRMIALSNSRTSSDGWTWKTIFRSAKVDFDDGLTEKDIFKKLDTALEDVRKKQKEFLKKMKLSIPAAAEKSAKNSK